MSYPIVRQTAYSTTYRFEEIKRGTSRNLKCRSCGKRFRRSTTFTQTINPWNKNADGTPKTRAEIWRELGEECEAWGPDDRCTKCDLDLLARPETGEAIDRALGIVANNGEVPS